MKVSSLVLVLALAGAVHAETKVELKGVHLCCPACIGAVGKILKTVDGVEGKCDSKARTITLTAADAATIQKAVDALAAGGFHGTPSDKEVSIKDDSGAVKGKVTAVTVSGIHNCCGSCNRSIKEALKKVEGVTADTATPKKNTFEVTGEFDAQELVKALNAAGFHVKIKK